VEYHKSSLGKSAIMVKMKKITVLFYNVLTIIHDSHFARQRGKNSGEFLLKTHRKAFLNDKT
jgi:hypothetical protein